MAGTNFNLDIRKLLPVNFTSFWLVGRNFRMFSRINQIGHIREKMMMTKQIQSDFVTK